jgi:hypothetical protein
MMKKWWNAPLAIQDLVRVESVTSLRELVKSIEDFSGKRQLPYRAFSKE